MHPRRILSLGNFFASAHYFLIIYIMTPYLAQFLPEEQVGLVVAAGAIGTLSAFPFMPRLVERYGARRLAIAFSFLVATMLMVLAGSPPFWIAALALALICGATPFIPYQLDLMLEATIAVESETGRVRTAFLTAGNIALIVTPLITGLVLDGGDAYRHVFLIAAITLAPFITLLLFEPVPHAPPPTRQRLLDTIRCVSLDPDIRSIALANLVLQFFYHLAPLYIPLYLHTELGIPWNELGWMFSVMLLPFVLFEYPAGFLADRWLGDRALLVAGFLIAGLSFAFVAFITSATPVALVLLVLVLTRVGAALVEAMVEGHFFRRISAADASTLSIFRMTRPVAALAAPLTASIMLAFTGTYLVFFFVMGGVVTVLGLMSARGITDIR